LVSSQLAVKGGHQRRRDEVICRSRYQDVSAATSKIRPTDRKRNNRRHRQSDPGCQDSRWRLSNQSLVECLPLALRVENRYCREFIRWLTQGNKSRQTRPGFLFAGVVNIRAGDGSVRGGGACVDTRAERTIRGATRIGSNLPGGNRAQ
jgi:hypothetical protein